MNAFACPVASPIPAQPSAPTRFLGRRPIVDAQRQLFGYQLAVAPGAADDPELATREMIDHWLMLLPEAPNQTIFVHCTRAVIMEGLATVLPPQNAVLSLLPDIFPDPDLIAGCEALRAKGYRFSLAGFLPEDPRTPLLKLAEFVHFDFPETNHAVRQEIYNVARGRRFIAGNVETDVHVRMLHTEGCSFFYGSFFAQPMLTRSTNLPKNYLIYLKLLAALDRDPADLRIVENLVSSDPSLCYRVLRLSNSALQGHAAEISTVREALLMVGDNAVRRMATVAIAGALSGQRSSAILEMALARARFCEMIAPDIGEDSGLMYLLGMVSTLESLLEAPLHRILESLPLRAEMKSALEGDGSLAASTLELVRSLEACDWTNCQRLQNRLNLAEYAIAAAHVDALRWASTMVATLSLPEMRT